MEHQEELAKVNYVEIAEKHFQKKMMADEVVHHIDGDRTNNSPENLLIMKKSQHSRLHAGLLGALEEWRKKILKPLCNTCLFVATYENMMKSGKDIDEKASSILLSIYLMSEAKSAPRTIIESLYRDALMWKNIKDHDCYEGKNLNIVKGRK